MASAAATKSKILLKSKSRWKRKKEYKEVYCKKNRKQKQMELR